MKRVKKEEKSVVDQWLKNGYEIERQEPIVEEKKWFKK